MDTVPQELTDRISDFLNPEDLKQVLTVSRAFQHSAEKVFLKKFNLKESNADRFLQLYAGSRFQYLRHVRFMPTFPKLVCGEGLRTEWGENCRETPSELLEKDRLYTHQINFLFRTLKTLEDRAGFCKAVAKLRLSTYPPRRAIDWPCLHRKCISWRIHLLHPETLPRLFSIQTLLLMEGGGPPYGAYFDPIYGEHSDDYLGWQPPSRLDLRILIDLASKLPNLERLDCSLETYHWGATMDIQEPTKHFTQDWAGPQRDTRHDFARALEPIALPASLKHVYFNLHRSAFHEKDRDQRRSLPNLVHPHYNDPFSASLRVLSYPLARLVLRIIADKSLFWPTDGTTPHWPNMRHVDVKFTSAGPNGSWYFQGPRGEGSDTSNGYEITQDHYEPFEKNEIDQNYDSIGYVIAHSTDHCFRVIPIEETLRPFLASFAKAASCMPLLQKAMLWTTLEFRPEEAFPYYRDCSDDIERQFEDPSQDRSNIFWGVAYASPGQHVSLHGMGFKDCCQRQLHWYMHDWQPDEALRSAFQDIGHREHPGDVIEQWASERGNKWLSSREHHDRELEECSLLKN